MRPLTAVKTCTSILCVLGMLAFSTPAEAQRAGEESVVPYRVKQLQRVEVTFGGDESILGLDLESMDAVDLDIRRDAQREAALSFGARGGLAARNYEIMQSLDGYEDALDRVFDFRQLLIKAPSGLLIEPPIISESSDALVVVENGTEAAVSDKIFNISKNANITTAPRNWRQYIVKDFSRVDPPPEILWPQDAKEQIRWSTWVDEGWQQGYQQAEDMFQADLNRLLADFNGMVRYRMLLAKGLVSSPFAMHEDRGITGGGSEMRIGDRAIRITGPSQFNTDTQSWKALDR